MRYPIILAALALMPLTACAGLQTQITTQTPAQITTFAEAEQAATLATKAADTYVTTAHPNAATLATISAASHAVTAAIVSLRADRDAGRSLAFGTLTAAITALAAAQK